VSLVTKQKLTSCITGLSALTRNTHIYRTVPYTYIHYPVTIPRLYYIILLYTIVSLFPSWLPPSFSVMFSKPFPSFSARLNAWATMVAGIWLMGECEINDCEVDPGFEGSIIKTEINGDDGTVTNMNMGLQQGVLVKRCRFLEESGCASVCVNSCKVPTQRFFNENMGLALTMTPDYDTYECQFSFGLTPHEEGEADAMNTPCLSRCPTAGALRKWHTTSASKPSKSSSSSTSVSANGNRINNNNEEENGFSEPPQQSSSTMSNIISSVDSSATNGEDEEKSVVCPLM
jgi:hypothetical protein